MAVQTEVKLVCDYCLGTEAGVQRGVKTRRWGLDGQQYEVDVCERHDKLMDEQSEPWRRISRKAGTKAREITRQRTKTSAAKTTLSYDKSEYLAWAKEKGFKVNPDGRPNPRLLRRFIDETATPAAKVPAE